MLFTVNEIALINSYLYVSNIIRFLMLAIQFSSQIIYPNYFFYPLLNVMKLRQMQHFRMRFRCIFH